MLQERLLIKHCCTKLLPAILFLQEEHCPPPFGGPVGRLMQLAPSKQITF